MENKKIKLAIFDIDNTLIKRGEQHVPKSALNAINALKDKGIEVMIATGRASYFIQDSIFEDIKPNYTVTINGACALDKDKSMFFSVPMDLEEVNSMIQFAKENNLGIAAKLENDMHVYNDMPTYINVYLQGNPNKHILKDHTQDLPLTSENEIPMGLFVMGDENLITSMDIEGNDSYFSHAYEGAYDVYSNRAGKIKGIEAVLDKLNLSWDNVVAFGDADNDIEMIQKAAIGVSMGNGIDSLKAEADYVTTDIDDNGIENALKKLELID